MSESFCRPRLLLHVCCGPCATAVIERLLPQYDITAYWFNPNIQPEEEWRRRLAAAQQVAQHFGLPLEIQTGGEEEFALLTRGLEHLPEGKERCQRCYALRLEKAIQAAREKDISYVATTLTISPHKSAETINEIGLRFADAAGLKFLAADFKKNNGFARSVQLSKELGLYRQCYCGCLFSLREKRSSP